MNDDLVYSIFVELAVLEGKRKPNGEWTTAEPSEIARLLKRAFGIVISASEIEPKPAE